MESDFTIIELFFGCGRIHIGNQDTLMKEQHELRVSSCQPSADVSVGHD